MWFHTSRDGGQMNLGGLFAGSDIEALAAGHEPGDPI